MSVAAPSESEAERAFAPVAHPDDPDAFREEVRAWLDATLPTVGIAQLTGKGEEGSA